MKNDNKQACILYDSYSNSYQVRSMKSLVELIVGQEIPFCFVDYSRLNIFLKELNPLFELCPRQIMQRSMMKSYTLAKEVI